MSVLFLNFLKHLIAGQASTGVCAPCFGIQLYSAQQVRLRGIRCSAEAAM